MVTSGGLWWYLELLFCFSILARTVFLVLSKYMREKQKKALFREIIAYILFFFFVLSFMGWDFVQFHQSSGFLGQQLVKISGFWLGLKTVVYQISKLVYLEKFHDVFCYCASRKFSTSWKWKYHGGPPKKKKKAEIKLRLLCRHSQ